MKERNEDIACKAVPGCLEVIHPVTAGTIALAAGGRRLSAIGWGKPGAAEASSSPSEGVGRLRTLLLRGAEIYSKLYTRAQHLGVTLRPNEICSLGNCGVS